MQTIAGLPGTHATYASCILIEFEKRVTTGPGAYNSTFYRFTDAAAVVVYTGATLWDTPANGSAFARQPFRLAAIITDGSIGSATEATFDDQNDVIKTLAIGSDMLDWKVRVWEAGIDANFGIVWMKLKIAGRTDNVDWDVAGSNNTVTVAMLHDSSPTQVNGPTEDYSPTCRFRFKSERCGYVGVATVCDRSLTNCTALGNQVRFGGFVDAPTPKTIIHYGLSAYSLPTRDQVLPPPEPASSEGG